MGGIPGINPYSLFIFILEKANNCAQIMAVRLLLRDILEKVEFILTHAVASSLKLCLIKSQRIICLEHDRPRRQERTLTVSFCGFLLSFPLTL